MGPVPLRLDLPGPEVTAETERPLTDVRDMLVVHTALLREFRLAPAAVERTGDGGTGHVTKVDRHLAFLTDLLHHHHAGEDALLWPRLRERLPEASLRLVQQVEAQHEDLDAALRQVTEARHTWTARADAVSRTALAQRLTLLHELLREHLDTEEQTLLPLAALHLTPKEWHGIGEAAVAAMPKPQLPLAFGMFAYEGDPAVLNDMLKTAPAVPRMLLPRIAPRVYAHRARQVHGTSSP